MAGEGPSAGVSLLLTSRASSREHLFWPCSFYRICAFTVVHSAPHFHWFSPRAPRLSSLGLPRLSPGRGENRVGRCVRCPTEKGTVTNLVYDVKRASCSCRPFVPWIWFPLAFSCQNTEPEGTYLPAACFLYLADFSPSFLRALNVILR